MNTHVNLPAADRENHAAALMRLSRLRREFEAKMHQMVLFLDELDAATEDLEGDEHEEGGDAEPSLGSTNHRDQSKAWNGSGWAGDDAEFGGDTVAEPDLEDSHDAEADPAENGLADLDALEEQLKGEPSLGFTEDIDQRISWGRDRASWLRDAEASGDESDLESRLPYEALVANRTAARMAGGEALDLARRVRRRTAPRRCGYPVIGTVD